MYVGKKDVPDSNDYTGVDRQEVSAHKPHNVICGPVDISLSLSCYVVNTFFYIACNKMYIVNKKQKI